MSAGWICSAKACGSCATAETCSPPPTPDVLADALLAALQGGLLLAQTLRRAEPLRDSLQAAIAHLETYAAGASRPLVSSASASDSVEPVQGRDREGS